MDSALTVLVSVAAGIHAALYGAWKDSPHEGFRAARFVREIVIAAVAGVFLSTLQLTDLFVVFVSAFCISRIATEFYKLFVRRERQDGFRIPTQVHLAGHLVPRWARLLLGLGYLGSIYGLYTLLRLLPNDMSPHVVGPIAGLLFGSAMATAGAYKDGLIEGFHLRKFIKSPASGTVGGWIVAFHTSQLAFIVLGSIALERIINELLFKILSPGYVPGKFRSCTAGCPEWLQRRHRLFLAPYALTWGVLLALWLAPFWPSVRADNSIQLVTSVAVLVAALALMMLHERDLRVSRS